MKHGTNVVRTTLTTLILAGAIGTLSPALAAEAPAAASGYLTDGNGNLVSDGSNKCVGDASLPEGISRLCDESTPATSAAEPKKTTPTSET